MKVLEEMKELKELKKLKELKELEENKIGLRKILDALSKGTNVKDLVDIHVGASEMLHFITNDGLSLTLLSF